MSLRSAYTEIAVVTGTVSRGLLDHGMPQRQYRLREKASRWLVMGHPGEFVLVPVPLAVYSSV